MKIGDSVGAIYKFTKGGIARWEFVEDKITKIVETKKGKKYHTKSKFRPLDAEDVDSNTLIQMDAASYMLTNEVFGLNDTTRQMAEQWVNWANENMDKAVGILSGK